MYVLVVNAGSSSLKYQLLDTTTENVLAKGLCDRIGLDGKITHKQLINGNTYEAEISMPNHAEATKLVVKCLLDDNYGCVKSMSEIEAVGHRIVHGGAYFSESVLLNDDVLAKLELCRDLAPLHTGAHIMGIQGCLEAMPGTPQVLVFDTAFHSTMPKPAYVYGIPYEMYEKYQIRRYGAHGTSHRFVASQCIKALGKPAEETKIVTCHLGNGSSIAAVANGKSIDTTMGFTPLEGLIMGTRCGNIDPDVVTYLQEKEGLTASQMSNVLNKKSGFLGLSCVSSDARDLDDAANEGNPKAKLTLKKLTYDITKFIGAYTAAMNGVDLIVFTGGIGENNSRLRRRVCENLTYLGLKFDYDANVARGVDTMISLPDSKVKVALITTNEELMIARDTMNIVQNEE